MPILDIVKDPETGKIKPVAIIAGGGVAVVGVLLVMSKSSSSSAASQAPSTGAASAGLSGDNTQALSDLQNSVDALTNTIGNSNIPTNPIGPPGPTGPAGQTGPTGPVGGTVGGNTPSGGVSQPTPSTIVSGTWNLTGGMVSYLSAQGSPLDAHQLHLLHIGSPITTLTTHQVHLLHVYSTTH
jgi:hypothetical protein